MAVGVKRLWAIDATGRIPVRVEDDLGVDKAAGGDSFVQSLAKNGGGCHLVGVGDVPYELYLYGAANQSRFIKRTEGSGRDA